MYSKIQTETRESVLTNVAQLNASENATYFEPLGLTSEFESTPFTKVTEILYLNEAHGADNGYVVCVAENLVGKAMDTSLLNISCELLMFAASHDYSRHRTRCCHVRTLAKHKVTGSKGAQSDAQANLFVGEFALLDNFSGGRAYSDHIRESACLLGLCLESRASHVSLNDVASAQNLSCRYKNPRLHKL